MNLLIVKKLFENLKIIINRKLTNEIEKNNAFYFCNLSKKIFYLSEKFKFKQIF